MKTTSSTNLIACAVIVGAFTVGFASGPAFADQESHAPFKFEFNFSPNELTSIPQAEALLVRLEKDVRRHCDGGKRLNLRRLDRSRWRGMHERYGFDGG